MKFTIRDLFLVTMIVALALGWGIDHWQLSGVKRDAERWREIALKYRDKLFQIQQPSRTSDPLEFAIEPLPNSSATPPIPPKP